MISALAVAGAGVGAAGLLPSAALSRSRSASGSFSGYEQLCAEIGRFFKTGKPPVSAEETIELVAFMEAAEESKRQGGAPVSVPETLAKARQAL